MKPLSIIFAGTGVMGVPTLNQLSRNSSFEIKLVITGPDMKAGRKMKIRHSPLKEAAIKNNLCIQQPDKISKLHHKIIQADPDILLVVDYGEILPKEIIEMPHYGAVNIHPSLLPLYRGASPIQETLLHGDTQSGVTWILMNDRMDAGDIIQQSHLPVATNDTYETLAHKLSSLAGEKTADVLSLLREQPLLAKQDESKATYCKKIRKEDGFLDFKKEEAQALERKIKAYIHWPGSYFFLNGKRIKVLEAFTDEQKSYSGCVRTVDGKSLVIDTPRGSLNIRKLQPESKRPLSAEEFLRGLRNIPSEVG